MNVSLIIVAIGSVWLMVDAVRKHRIPTWARRALALAGVLLLSWSVASFLLDTHSTLTPPKLISFVGFVRSQIGGIGLGIIITLFMSGALSKRNFQDDKPAA
jgi:hypothetical protein